MVSLPYRVLCVCLGNICRSPTAEVILRHQACLSGLDIQIDSAGTSNYHPGKAPDVRSQQYAKARGYDLSGLRARQIRPDDFEQFDLILAMDETNLSDLKQLQQQIGHGSKKLAQLALMSQHDQRFTGQALPDPYYGEKADFERVISQCESSAEGWIAQWQQHLPVKALQEPANA